MNLEEHDELIRLRKEEHYWKVELQAAERKAQRAQEDAKAAHDKLQQLELEFFQFKQRAVSHQSRLERELVDAKELYELGKQVSSTTTTNQTEEIQHLLDEKDELQRLVELNLGTHVMFDPNKTRILHIKRHARVDAHSSTAKTPAPHGSASSLLRVPSSTGFNQDKYIQRLTDMFKKQISLLKEGLYLLFGWKVEVNHVAFNFSSHNLSR